MKYRVRSLATGSILAAFAATASAAGFSLTEASIADIRKVLDAGAISSVELTALYLNRIDAYDHHGPRLNSVIVPNESALEDAARADAQRASGSPVGPLSGVTFTVKDSYKVKGLTVAAGSPAFATLVANENAFTVQRILDAGGILLGKTNMPPLANGGMQRGVYGRAESPYNAQFLTAAWASGSSNGSATATAASFATFGMGEETVSSGRSPASNNGLVAYTPSRGLISIRGNWPLFPLRDVVVPHTRTVGDLFAVLDQVVATDPRTDGDFWRNQKVVRLPVVESVRPATFNQLADRNALRGKRIAVPTMYLGKDSTLSNPITVRPSILALWEKAAADLRALGATVVEVDFKPMHDYDADRPGTRAADEAGFMPKGWWFRFGPGAPRNIEMFDLVPHAYEEFLRSCKDPRFPSWAVVDAAQVFPDPPGSVEARGKGLPHGYEDTKAEILDGLKPPESLPGYRQALLGVEKLRKVLFEDWLRSNGFDAVVFPANADVGRSNADVDEHAYDDANRNGVRFSNMNHAIRHLGIPSVSVPMGTMVDTGMPVNLTFVGPAYADNTLLAYAFAYEQATHHRHAPLRVPALADESFVYDPASTIAPSMRAEKQPPVIEVQPDIEVIGQGHAARLRFRGSAKDASGIAVVRVYLNGHRILLTDAGEWQAEVPAIRLQELGNPGDREVKVLVLARDRLGNASARRMPMALPALP